MPTQTVIPAGYRLTVDTWENDADNHYTQVLEGLSLELTKLYVDLCKLFNGDSEVANLYDPSPEEKQVVYEELTKIAYAHPGSVDTSSEDATIIGREMMDKCGDIGLIASEFFTRVVDDFKVEYLPEDVIFADVTAQF